MEEEKYEVKIDGSVIATEMDIATATLLVKAVFREYQLDRELAVEVRRIYSRRAEWLKDGYGGYPYCACANCGWIHDIHNYGKDYCPHCGARMGELIADEDEIRKYTEEQEK